MAVLACRFSGSGGRLRIPASQLTTTHWQSKLVTRLRAGTATVVTMPELLKASITTISSGSNLLLEAPGEAAARSAGWRRIEAYFLPALDE